MRATAERLDGVAEIVTLRPSLARPRSRPLARSLLVLDRAASRLVEGDLCADGLEETLELLGLVLGRALLERLGKRLDELLGLRVGGESAGGVSDRPRTLLILGWPSSSCRRAARERERRDERRTSTRFMPGMSALTSRMAFAFCAASILVRLTLKTVFSLGAAGSSAAAAAGAAAAGAADAAGRATSTMLRRDCGHVQRACQSYGLSSQQQPTGRLKGRAGAARGGRGEDGP